MSNFEIYRARDGSGGSGDEFSARSETEDGDVVGYFSPYLRQEFLKGYLTYLGRQHPDNPQIEDIPEVIEHVLDPIVPETPEASESPVRMYGQVSRFIARGMNEDYWRLAAHRNEQGKKWDPDIDVLVHAASVETIWQTLTKKYNVTQVTPDDEYPDRLKFVATHGFFEIHASMGKIPTVDIYNIVISIKDSESGDRLFHIDISERTDDPEVIDIEKRVGETFSWQDGVYVHFTKKKGRVYYHMGKEQKEAMFRPSAIATRATDESSLIEVVLRAIRIGNFFPLEEKIDLRRRFAPFFTSDSLLRFQFLILEAMRSNGQPLPEHNLKLLQEELRVCLDIDPLWTIASLRDTSIGWLIPGLAHLTPYDWDAVLRSDRFAFEVTPEGQRVPLNKRDWDYIKRQRVLYKTKPDKSGKRRMDGTIRFLNALDQLELVKFVSLETEELYDELWTKSTLQPEIEFGTQDSSVEPPSGHVATRVGDSYISFPPGKAPKTRREALGRIRELEAAVLGKKPLELMLREARRIIRFAAKERSLSLMRKNLEQNNYINSIALAYELLKDHTHLTARQMKWLYEGTKTTFVKRRFRGVVYDLKRLGFIDIYDQQRLHPKGHDERLGRYVLREGSVRLLKDLIMSDDFKPYLLDVDKSGSLKDTAKMLMQFGVTTVEALQSFRKRDYLTLRRRVRKVFGIKTENRVRSDIVQLQSAYMSFVNATRAFDLVY